jgi:hypothetical protein
MHVGVPGAEPGKASALPLAELGMSDRSAPSAVAFSRRAADPLKPDLQSPEKFQNQEWDGKACVIVLTPACDF